MKNTHLALAAFAISIICAAGAAYSAIINGIYYPNGATLGCVTAALTGGYLWYHSDQPEQEDTKMNDPAELASYWATIFAALIFIVAIIILGQNK